MQKMRRVRSRSHPGFVAIRRKLGQDWWSCGCITAEMMLGKPLFTGESSWGQMYETWAEGDLSETFLKPASPGAGTSNIIVWRCLEQKHFNYFKFNFQGVCFCFRLRI